MGGAIALLAIWLGQDAVPQAAHNGQVAGWLKTDIKAKRHFAVPIRRQGQRRATDGQAVFEKKLYDSPQQFPRKMAKGTVEAFIKHLSGEEVPKKNFIPCAHYYYEHSVNDESRISEQW